ncbi:hypothetical protein [Thioalkalivibrio sp.]|uniref:hypothetical protein n=1 Tax=Thioalkalivibrio sp. TaxID=2093813 RepID=UPI0035612B55
MTDELSDLDLVKWYFNVCNTALATPNANAVGNLVESLVLKATPNRFIAVELVDDEGRALGQYTTRFVDGQFGPVEEGEHHPETRFTLRRSFLRSVVDRSDEYVEHPEKLDWSWMLPV